MPVLCPCCTQEHDLIFYPKVPIGLHDERHMGDAIITENTDVACINCYWQGSLSELLNSEAGGIVHIAKKRVKAVLG